MSYLPLLLNLIFLSRLEYSKYIMQIWSNFHFMTSQWLLNFQILEK